MKTKHREIIKSLIQIVWADGNVDERERELLGRMLVELDLSHKEISEVAKIMMEASDAPDLDAILAEGDESARDLMKVLLALAMTKGELGAPELRYVQAIAHKLQLDKEELEQLKKEVRKLPEQK